MKYPVGIQDFSDIINGGYVYVDKTALVYKLVSEGKVYFLSRPRRFGKSLLVSTLENYFLGREELFKGLAIEKLEKDWIKYPVFHLDFNSINFDVPGALEDALEGFVGSLEAQYDRTPFYKSIGKRFEYVLQKAHEATGQRCVVLVDEYDKPLLDVFDSKKTVNIGNQDVLLYDYHRDILQGFYSTLKAADRHLQFVFMTGVTKFSQVSLFSGFNQLLDISMSFYYETICGITEDELEHYFSESIAELADTYKVSAEQMRQMLKQQYDGYHFSERMTNVYNPFSLLSAFMLKQIKDYWFESGSPSLLLRLLPQSRENINEMVGEYYESSEFYIYKANPDLLLPLIYQSGYLTIKDYDPQFRTFKLDFPNAEVCNGFLTAMSANYFNSESDTKSFVRQLVRAMQAGDTDRMRDLLTAFLADVPYEMRRKSDEKERERYFQLTLFLIFTIASCFNVDVERHQSKGRADCIVGTPKYVYIFEFKLDGSADEALRQIDEKGYAVPYQADQRQIFKIGANFSSETGTIAEWKVAE